MHVAVVGGGVAGLASAWQLARAGAKVTLLEQFAFGHDRGSSHGPTRVFRFVYEHADYVYMARESLALWRALEQGEELVRLTGGLDLGPPDELAPYVEALTSAGATFDWLQPADVARAYPWLARPEQPSFYSPDTGVIAAARALARFREAAAQAGATLRDRARVDDLQMRDDGAVVVVGGDRLEVDRVVVAAGPWAQPLLDRAGIRLPVRVTREQVFYFRGPPDVIPVLHWDDGLRYSVPPLNGGGVKVAEHHTGATTTADDRSFDQDPAGAARIGAYVAGQYPGLDPVSIGFETCLYTTTPDEDFVLDARGPLIVASPCSGHGFKFAPLVGAIVCALALGTKPPVPIERFALARFD